MRFLTTFQIHDFLDTLVSLTTAFVLGTLIGAERQYRQRTAGLRTNVLVAVGAAAFVDLAMHLTGADEALPAMRDQLVERLENAKYPVADIEVVETGDDLLEIVAKLVSTAVDPNELNAVVGDLRQQAGVRHATWEVSTAD